MVEFAITMAVGSVLAGVVLGGWILSGLRRPHHRPH